MPACPSRSKSMEVNKTKFPPMCLMGKIGNKMQIRYRSRQGQGYEGNKNHLCGGEIWAEYMLHGMGSCRELEKSVQGRRHIVGLTQGTKELDEFSVE